MKRNDAQSGWHRERQLANRTSRGAFVPQVFAQGNAFQFDWSEVRVRIGGRKVEIKQVHDRIWLVSFMDYDLGYCDAEACRLEPIQDPFRSNLLPV